MERQQLTKTNQSRDKRGMHSAAMAVLPTRAPVHPLLQLQRSICNQAMGRFFQAKLEIGQPGDIYEQEADRIAEQVMRMPEPISPLPSHGSGSDIQRKCAECASGKGLCPECAEEEEAAQLKPLPSQITPLVHLQMMEEPKKVEAENLQTKENPGNTSKGIPHIETSINALRGCGHPLPRPVRAFFEPRFGHDFSQVRVHTNAQAAGSAQAVNALAFTIGQDIILGAGQYAPEKWSGQRLLAHELTHVIQQKRGQESTVRRYTPDELSTCPCLTWSLPSMFLTAEAMVAGGQFTGRPYASSFMDHFLHGDGSDKYVLFDDFKADLGGKAAFDNANARLSNELLAEADGLPCGSSRSGVGKSATVPGHFSHGTDLFYAMGGFSLVAYGTGTVQKNCDASSNCTSIESLMDIRYRVNDFYDWKAEPGGCTPSTGETGCLANTKTVTLPVFGVICDECLNRLAIHGWANEFMVKVRGLANDHTISGPCGFRNPTTDPATRNNQARDR